MAVKNSWFIFSHSTSTFVPFTQLNCCFAYCSQPQPKRHAVGQVTWHIGGATENRLLHGDPWRLLGALGKMDEIQLWSTLLQGSLLAFKYMDSISCHRYWFHWTFICPWQYRHCDMLNMLFAKHPFPSALNLCSGFLHMLSHPERKILSS